MQMKHFNGDLCCAIDTETTGTDPFLHEIVQLAILPLDSNFKPRTDVMPLDLYIKPDHPERIDPKAMGVNRITAAEIANRGFDSFAAVDILRRWIDKLGLPFTRYGNRKRIVPLGQNYAFDRAFLIRWLEPGQYDELFSPTYRDTMVTACYLNDRAGLSNEPVPFNRQNLTHLASTLKVDHPDAHNALADCRITAEIYRRMMNIHVFGLGQERIVDQTEPTDKHEEVRE